MASSFAVSRSHLLLGICLPLAVLLGYMLAWPLESGTLAVVTLVITILLIPAIMRWHQPLLIFAWNAPVVLFFLPGFMALWMPLATLAFGIAVMNRTIGRKVDFLAARQVTYSLLGFTGVVVVTSILTGGFGFHMFGSSTFGGKQYFFIYCSVMSYFAISTMAIPSQKVYRYTALMFLSGLLVLISYVGTSVGPASEFLSYLLSTTDVLDDRLGNLGGPGGNGLVRLGSLTFAVMGLFYFLMAKYGISGLFELRRPWRMGLFLIAIGGCLFSSFRSNLVMCGLIFAFSFYWEGLCRTRYLLVLVMALALSGGLLWQFANRLPLAAQRTLAVLPYVELDGTVRADAEGSSKWRIDIWKDLLPDVPKYLIKGKGYALTLDELYMASVADNRGFTTSSSVAAANGDYHSGPLSVVIPFGLAGVGTFIWFLVASMRALHRNWLYGDPSLRMLNTFLLSFFAARIVFFMFIFGSLYSDIHFFTGIVAFSVAVNRGVAKRKEVEAVEPEFVTDEVFA